MSDSDVVNSKTNTKLEHMLTTVDNPFDPFTQFNEWFQFDTAHGYHSAGLLARVLMVSNELSEVDQALATERAIDEVVRENVLGVSRKVSRDTSKDE